MAGEWKSPKEVLAELGRKADEIKTQNTSANARNVMVLQQVLRQQASLSELELECMKDAILEQDFTYQELVSLESVARERAELASRTQGWHAGFKDLLDLFRELRREKAA